MAGTLEVMSDQDDSSLLRHACDGDFLNRYFAGTVASAAYLRLGLRSFTGTEH